MGVFSRKCSTVSQQFTPHISPRITSASFRHTTLKPSQIRIFRRAQHLARQLRHSGYVGRGPILIRCENTKTKSAISLPGINEGVAMLLLVSFLWGSYTPALRTIFTQTGAPLPILVAAIRGMLQVGLLGTGLALGLDGDKATTLNGSVTPSPAEQDKGISSLMTTVMASLEIGAYNTSGTLLQTWGLSLTTAARSAFLIQATALFTPCLAALFGMKPTRTLWLSSFVAFLATVLVSIDQTGSTSTATTTAAADLTSTSSAVFGLTGMVAGDAATVGAALCYSMATVRIPQYTKTVAPIKLALGKSTVLAVVSSLALGWHSLGLIQQGLPVATDLWPGGWTDPLIWKILIWSAVGPGALSAYFHIKGQSMVGPTEAQVVFSTVPLWSGLLAAWLLPGEQVGHLTWVGGLCMVVAGLIAAIPQKKRTAKQLE